MRDNRGQASGIVMTIAAMLIIVIVGALVAVSVYELTHEEAKESREITYENTTDYTFANAVNDETTEWENVAENIGNQTTRTGAGEENIVIGPDNVAIWCRDNTVGGGSTNYDNGIIYDNVNLENTGTRDGVSKAVVELKYWLAENYFQNTVALDVVLCDGTENRTIVHIDNLENASAYTSLENDITDLLGWSSLKYTLYIRVGFDQDGSASAENDAEAYGVVYIDDARLKITTFDQGYDEQAVVGFGEKLPIIFTLLIMVGVVTMAAFMLKYLGAI